MVFENETPWSALLARSVLDADRIAASVVVRVTYSWRGRELHPADEQVWPVSPTPSTSPRGPMEADGPFLRGGVDLFLFGSACADNGRPVSAMDVSVEAPAFSRRA